jgi:hypothetical protein
MEYLEVPNQVYKGLKTDQFDMSEDHFRRRKKKHHPSSAPMIAQAPVTGSLTTVPAGVPTSVSGSETPIADMSAPDIEVAPDVTAMATDQLPSDGSEVDDGTNTFENYLNIFQKAGRYASKEAKQAGKFATKEIGTVAGAVALAPLLPLKPMMKKVLNKKGVKHSNTIKDIANKFYNEVVHKSSTAKANTFDYPERNLEDCTENNIVEEAIDIVEAIVNFIKNIKAKAAKGTLLTDTEKDILDGSNSAVKKIKGKEKGGAKPMKINFLGIGIGALVLIVILVLIFRKK